MSLRGRLRDSSGQDWTNPLAAFSVNQVLQTTVGQLQVETLTASDTSGLTALRPGVHRFQLVVQNDQGVLSDPVIATVKVTPQLILKPTAVAPQVVIPASVINGIPSLEKTVASSTKRRQSTKPKEAKPSKPSKKPKPGPKR